MAFYADTWGMKNCDRDKNEKNRFSAWGEAAGRERPEMAGTTCSRPSQIAVLPLIVGLPDGSCRSAPRTVSTGQNQTLANYGLHRTGGHQGPAHFRVWVDTITSALHSDITIRVVLPSSNSSTACRPCLPMTMSSQSCSCSCCTICIQGDAPSGATRR